MQFLRGGGGGGGGGAMGTMAWEVVKRHFSRKRAVDVRRINPKVPKEEAVAISGRLLQILADHGPLTVGNTWNHAKDASIDGLNSKTHMKILLKWMWGRRIIKLSCTQAGNTKKFLYSPFTAADSEAAAEEPSPPEPQQPKKKQGGNKHGKGQPKKQRAAAA
ncbi:uncharacterized protein LOC100833957 [Brachypodium distachyon]|uniref:Uncharacterized protein n=1 Tax=Brachypodium distachyon TaxID=15368 RepID=I1GKR4_BRADI|nr:uncharacterized protein LOC100833957 [Brachypodium distachyon]KQK12057.1 hypothetical protein BRADI_1g01320v3 [Brachypodium distachyon]|eukprot:XP_003561083.1 uncharacterized protein LOC100833957 [Brachypodium distachyon]